MYLLDTDILSAWMKPSAPSSVQERMAASNVEIALSAITVGEIYFGAYLTATPERYVRPLEAILKRLRVIAFDSQAAKVYGRIKANLKQKGQPLAEPDLRIAAICLAHGLTLITGNTRHFSRIQELRLENWLKP